MDNMIKIRGAGGGKGGGESHTHYEAPDSLQSIEFARVLDVIGEGEIGGLVNGLQSIFLDDTPVQNADGTFNFTNCSFAMRTGTPSQSPIPGFPAAETESVINTQVKHGTPIVRRISDPNVNAARVTIGIPAMQLQDVDDGDINNTSVSFVIEVNSNGSGWLTAVAATIPGKCTSRYQRSYRIPLNGVGPWNIRVSRVTADSTSSALVNATWWDSLTEISDYLLTYPNTAYVGINIDAKQFSSIPTRKYLVNLLKIRVPSNYDPVTRIYSGGWDGTFKTVVSNNPAWCLYDMLTSERYGLGKYIPSALTDKWVLYTIGQYCDVMVSDGFGGLEPRYSLNVWNNSPQAAYDLLQSMVGAFRGMLYASGGALSAVADMPGTPKMLYTNANVLDGEFTYQGTPRNQRHSVCNVTWKNPDNQYADEVESVDDREALTRYGVRKLELRAYGCTSRGLAHRLGRWALYSERYDNVVTFKTGLDKTARLAPGDLIEIADSNRSGVRMGGRIVAASTQRITLDAPVTLKAGVSYSIKMLTPDGERVEVGVMPASGAVSSVDLVAALAQPPLVGSMWVMASSLLDVLTARIVSIKESGKNTFEVSALEYNEHKYSAVENGIALSVPVTSTLSSVGAVDAPTGLVLTESLYEDKIAVKSRLTASWSAPRFASYYAIQWRRELGSWQMTTATSISFDISDTRPGVYQFRVSAVDALGRQSVPLIGRTEVYGLTKSPEVLGGLDFTAYNGLAMLSWPQSSDLDVRVGGHIRIKHSPRSTGATWGNATDIGPSIPGIATQAMLPLLPGTYLAKAVDSGGYESLESVEVITNAPSVIAFNAVDQLMQSPGFVGQSVGCLAIDGKLKIASSTTVDGWPSIDAIRDFDTGDDVAPQATYYFDRISDLGSVDTVRITAGIEADIRPTTDTVDTWASVDVRQSWDGTVSGMADATIQISTTESAPELGNWSDWSPLRVGDYRARAFRFRVLMQSFDPFVAIDLLGLSVTVDMPDRVEEFSNLLIPADGQFVAFSPPFRSTPTVGITAQGLQPGEYVDFSARSQAGFFVAIRNASGAGVARSIDVMAKGWGYDAT